MGEGWNWNPWTWINQQAEEINRRRLEAERLRQEEEERLRREEEERKRREEEERRRREEEERKRQEEERLRQEEAERQRLAAEEQKRQDDLAAQGQDATHEMGIGATLAGSMSGFRQLEEKMAKAEEPSGADFRLLDEQSQRDQEAEEKRKQEEGRTKAQEYLFAINVFGSVEEFKKSVIDRADEAAQWLGTEGDEVAQKMKGKELHEALTRDEDARDREGQEAAKQEEAKRQELNEALTRDEDARDREGQERGDEFAQWRDSEAVFQSPSSDENNVTPLTKEQEERRVELSVSTSRTKEETDELIALSNQSRKWDIYRHDQDKRQKENEKNNLAKVNSVKSTMPEEKMIAFAKTMPQGSTTNLEVAVGDILIEKYLRGQLDTYNDKELEESVIHLLRRRVTIDKDGGNGIFSSEDGWATRDMLRRNFETAGDGAIDLKSIKTTENELYKVRKILSIDTGNKATEKHHQKAMQLGARKDEMSSYAEYSTKNNLEWKNKNEILQNEISELSEVYKKAGREKEFQKALDDGGLNIIEGLGVLATMYVSENPFVEESADHFRTANQVKFNFVEKQNKLKIEGNSKLTNSADIIMASKIRYLLELTSVPFDVAGGAVKNKVVTTIFDDVDRILVNPIISKLPQEVMNPIKVKFADFFLSGAFKNFETNKIIQKKNEIFDDLAIGITQGILWKSKQRKKTEWERFQQGDYSAD